MKTIRFITEDSNEIEFSRELKKRVQEYFNDGHISKHGDIRLYVKTFVMLALYLIPFVLILTLNLSPWLGLLMTVVIGIGEAGIGMNVMHDAVHGAYSDKSRMNKFVGLSMFLLGSNTINWRIQHNVNHHSYTNIYQYDPDISTKAVIRLCEHAPLKRYMRFQHYYAFPLYGLMTVLKLFGEIFTLIENNKEGTTQEMGGSPTTELLKLIVIKVVYFSLFIGLPLIFTQYSIWQILIGFFVIHLVAGIIMSTVFQMAHVVTNAYQPLPEEGVIHCERLVHQLKSTSDFGKGSGLLNWYIGGLDFQVEHHLFPTVSHIHYAALAPIVEKTALEYGLVYNTNETFAHALVSHYKRLKQLGREDPKA